MTLTITFKGVELTVTGEEKKGHNSMDRDLPSEPGSFDVEEIIYNGINVFEIYDTLNKVDEISNICLEKL